MLGIIVTYFAGVVLAVIWFGTDFALDALSEKLHLPILSSLGVALAAAIPTAVILSMAENCCLNFAGALDFTAWLIAAATVIVTSLIVLYNNAPIRQGKELILGGLNGALMEIPQRLMMQTFLIYVLTQFGNGHAGDIGIVLNGAVWCTGITIQNFITKTKFDGDFFREMVASFVFSIGVGYVLLRTNLILMTALSHFSERIVNTLLRKYRANHAKAE